MTNAQRSPVPPAADRWPLVLEFDPSACRALIEHGATQAEEPPRGSGIAGRWAMLPTEVLDAAVRAIEVQVCDARMPDGADGPLWTVVPLDDGRLIVTRIPSGAARALAPRQELEARAETHRRLRNATFEALGAPAWIVGPDGRVRAANAAARARAALTTTPTRPLGAWLTAAKLTAARSVENAVAEAVSGGSASIPVQDTSGRGGALVFEALTLDGRAMGVCVTLIDPSAQMPASVETTPQKPSDRPGERRESVARLRKLFELEKHNALCRMAGATMHAFNNTLAVVQGCATSLRQVLPEGSAGVEEVSDLELAVRRGGELTQQLVTFAQKHRATPMMLEVTELFSAAVATLERRLPGTLQMRVEVAPETPPVMVDPRQIREVIELLVTSAAQACNQTGTVIVGAHRVLERDEDGNNLEWAEIFVRDHGEPIEAQAYSELFDPYPSPRVLPRASGFGLAAVRGIVRGAAGELRVESSTKETTVYLRLPSLRQLQAAAAGSRSLPSIPPVGRTAPAERPQTVLVIVQEPTLRSAVKVMLSRMGLVATEADGLFSALQRCPNPLDLLLVDVSADNPDSLVTARRILEQRPTARVLHLRDAAARAGAEHVAALVKPFNAASFESAVVAVLGERAARHIGPA